MADGGRHHHGSYIQGRVYREAVYRIDLYYRGIYPFLRLYLD